VLAAVDQEERQLLEERSARAEAAANGAKTTIRFGALIALLFVVLAGAVITRSLNHQLSGAVSNIRSSSAELQAAANQQAASSREQATAMAEIATTIRELLASSRQIADSAQRVAQIATETATGARSGDQTVARAQDSVGGIRQQVDLIVTHMLELGKKSQQIGSILEIINELAEQTNILAINATIEAAGAGDSASASRWWRTRSASSPTGWAARRRRSAA
jgi:methyl-accepting chemotaxis protein